MTDEANASGNALRDQLHALPKIELHRHLEGSLRLETLSEIASTFNVGLPHDIEALRPHVQIVDSDLGDLRLFLSKFDALRRFYRSPEIIERVTREAIADCAADNIRYLELRFTPRALAATMNFPLEDVSAWVVDAAKRAAEEFDIEVRLIVSMNRHESVKLGAEVARIAVDHLGNGVVGLDLAGNEASFPATPFAPIFREAKQAGLKITVHAGEAKQAGLKITVHAGEWSGADSVREAIEHIGADRLGHGVRIVQDSSVVRIARERKIAFEVCVTSNLQSGSIKHLEQHPLRELHHLSLLTTINTDDPGVSDITLTDEMVVVMNHLGLTLDDIKTNVLNAVQVAFLPDAERARLAAQFREDLDGHP